MKGVAVNEERRGGRVAEYRPLPSYNRFIALEQSAVSSEAHRSYWTRKLEGATVPNQQLFEKVEPIVNTFCPGLAKMPYHIDRFGGGHHGHDHAAYARVVS